MIKHRKKHPVSPSILMRGREIEKKKKKNRKGGRGRNHNTRKERIF
jgi:hypothetical protein